MLKMARDAKYRAEVGGHDGSHALESAAASYVDTDDAAAGLQWLDAGRLASVRRSFSTRRVDLPEHLGLLARPDGSPLNLSDWRLDSRPIPKPLPPVTPPLTC